MTEEYIVGGGGSGGGPNESLRYLGSPPPIQWYDPDGQPHTETYASNSTSPCEENTTLTDGLFLHHYEMIDVNYTLANTVDYNTITITDGAGRSVVSIDAETGNVTISGHVSINEASQEFWNAVGSYKKEQQQPITPSVHHEPTLLNIVNQDGNVIKIMDNPSEAVQLAAVKQNGLALEYIKDPSLEVQLAAVKERGDAIKYIKNPSEEIQLAAVMQNGHTIERIKNPSEAVQLAAVKQNSFAVRHIDNPSDDLQLVAVTKFAGAFRLIKNPSEAVQKIEQYRLYVAAKLNEHTTGYIFEDTSSEVYDSYERAMRVIK